MAAVLKTARGASSSWVRIPRPPLPLIEEDLRMARYFDVHPVDPQPRLVAQAVALLRDDALIAYPTDSCYALGCRLDSATGARPHPPHPRARRPPPLHARVRRLRAARRSSSTSTTPPSAASRRRRRGRTRSSSRRPRRCRAGWRTPKQAHRRRAHPRPPGRAGAAARARLAAGVEHAAAARARAADDRRLDASRRSSTTSSTRCSTPATAAPSRRPSSTGREGVPEVVRVGAGRPDRFA